LKEGILEVMECGRTRAKRRDDEEGEVKEMKKELERLKKEKRKKNVEHTRFKMLKNRIEKLRKKIRTKRMKVKVDALVSRRGKDSKQYWKMLKELGGWGKGGSKIPATVFDEEGKEQEGKERLEAWKEAFRKLGIDDIAFALRVEADVRKMERESEMKECEMKEEEKENEDENTREERARMKLNKNITDTEVSKAIDQLQNYKAPGQDGVIGEILKAGGEKIRKAVWVLCCVAWKNERVPNDWMQGVVVPLYETKETR